MWGTAPAPDGKCIFAFTPEDRQIWSLGLSDGRLWPDCTSINTWGCLGLIAGEADGRPGDEIIALAQHATEYPTRISIIDPMTREVRATFWHMGHINSIRLQKSFFNDRRPAILAFGMNNKLDGFREMQPGDEPPHTEWDIVGVAMILDPMEVLDQGNALGPPRTDRLQMPQSRVHAYAFLNVSQNTLYAISNGQQEQRPAPPDERGDISDLSPAPDLPEDGTQPWFNLSLVGGPGTQPCQMTVDRNLAVRRVLATNCPPALEAQTDRYWRAKWKILIQHGEYVDRGGADGISAAE